jgi:hypothetical protein
LASRKREDSAALPDLESVRPNGVVILVVRFRWKEEVRRFIMSIMAIMTRKSVPAKWVQIGRDVRL